jgi:hypothetical protein
VCSTKGATDDHRLFALPHPFTCRTQKPLPSLWKGVRLRLDTRNVHTPTMTLRNAALLALVGTILMTALLVWNFIFIFLNVLRDLVPAVTLFSPPLYSFGWFSVMVFFFVFHRAQRRLWFWREGLQGLMP